MDNMDSAVLNLIAVLQAAGARADFHSMPLLFTATKGRNGKTSLIVIEFCGQIPFLVGIWNPALTNTLSPTPGVADAVRRIMSLNTMQEFEEDNSTSYHVPAMSIG